MSNDDLSGSFRHEDMSMEVDANGGNDASARAMQVDGDGDSQAMDESFRDALEFGDADAEDEDLRNKKLDCYPYTFSPLLLFAQSDYFDKGHSNYNSVAAFFQSCLSVMDDTDAGTGAGSSTNTNIDCDMLEGVLFDRKNKLYEDLIQQVIQNEMIVVCCIDAHFTALKVFSSNGSNSKPCGVYYDPLKAHLTRVAGDSLRVLLAFLLLKCNYGDSQHIQDNSDYYTNVTASQTRKVLYKLWKKIHVTPHAGYLGITTASAALDLQEYLLVNDARSNQLMSVQLTSNTCYFQSYLFALLCKVGGMNLGGKEGKLLQVPNSIMLRKVTIAMAKHLLQFFVMRHHNRDNNQNTIMRPLTNSNVLLDFYRYLSAPYHQVFTDYLKHQKQKMPDYEGQYVQLSRYFKYTKVLHKYQRFSTLGAMASTPNTKRMQNVTGTEGAVHKLARSEYYKYRAANFMFGWNAAAMNQIENFCEFNALRKNQLMHFVDVFRPYWETLEQLLLAATNHSSRKPMPYREYYFMPQYEVGQGELVMVHHYAYVMDSCALSSSANKEACKMVQKINEYLAEHIYYSTQKRHNYDKFLPTDGFRKTKKAFRSFLDQFMTPSFFAEYVGLGFSDINPKEKEINSLTQTVFYTTELMREQANRQSFEFEKECINQMARSNIRRYLSKFNDRLDANQSTRVNLKIGLGYTYSKYNTLMHFLNVMECYWKNPDLSNIHIFGKDIRALLVISSQKIFFHKGHSGCYHYGPLEDGNTNFRGGTDLDLAVASSTGSAIPTVSKTTRGGCNELILADRAFEYHYLKGLLHALFNKANGERFKSDNEVLNLCLLSLLLDFGLYDDRSAALLNLPFLHELQHLGDTKELQVEIANKISDFDRKNTSESITRSRVQELLFETSYKFLINKDFPIQSRQFKMIRALNADSAYQSYVLLVKIYMSLCQINRSVEVDYYKVRCDEEFRIIIPTNFSRVTGDYLEEITRRYTFSERGGVMLYDELPVFDLRPHQPIIDLYKIRFDSASEVQSMVKHLEISNVFHGADEKEKYLVFIADNVLVVDVPAVGTPTVQVNNNQIEISTIFFNEAISFVPAFKYKDSEDVVLFTSHNVHYLVDQGGQFSTDYYGMRHELIGFIKSEEIFLDLNDEHSFKSYKLCELVTESKTVVYFPDYLLQVPNREQLINLLDLALKIRNVSFFILVLFYLRRSSIALEFVEKESDSTRISGPWREAILYVLNRASMNSHYDSIFSKQFFNLNQHKDVPLERFINILCDNFTRYQRYIDGQYQIIPTLKQKNFLKRIICSEECFHFSEVGTGKTKVILPLLCQTFLSNNAEAHVHFARGGKRKHILVIVVPEHLVTDARTQVFRYCLNLNYREEYRVYDDIFALMHPSVKIMGNTTRPAKKIFVTSFNQFKKALTYDEICRKVRPYREHFLIVADEVDDWLDRNKLVFNICSNKSNSFNKQTLDLFFEISQATYNGSPCPSDVTVASPNPDYWNHLYRKFRAIHEEIQDASRSINKSFGIFNEFTLRHCNSNILHDIEGYKSLIARPYESVNRAMPGSYYSDVERTIYLTYVILSEDVAKYDELFQNERKFISFEYWNEYFVHDLDYDDLVYGHEKLSEVVSKHPATKTGLTKYLYEITLRRMEIRDKSRSVSSIDVIFNFDCIGFTGTPFLDNYPTFAYIRQGRIDEIPSLIDRSFYAYSSEHLSQDEFQRRFTQFQGKNSEVECDYVSSDFILDSFDEMAILESIFQREMASAAQSDDAVRFNAIVDLCGIFKRSSIHDVRNLIMKHFGEDSFHYIYHISSADNSDRVLSIASENDVPYDEEFYNHMRKLYGKDLRNRIFFFIDNRNVIGKDIPYQLIYQNHFGLPLFAKSVILAHDVDDWTAIWQAMGRSRTMNETFFSIYKSGISDLQGFSKTAPKDIKLHPLTRQLYIQNCDSKMAGNISSIYLTLIALLNLSLESFYYCDEIVNVFMEKMEKTIESSVAEHEDHLVRAILSGQLTSQMLYHILLDKFRRSGDKEVAAVRLNGERIEEVLRNIVQQKFEQRVPNDELLSKLIIFLCGEQKSQMEISYTKQQQKQKQKQQNKNQDSDAMGIFDKKNQMQLAYRVDNYFESTLIPIEDVGKILLNLPVSVPIFQMSYNLGKGVSKIKIYPTVQFMYSHHIAGNYVSKEVQALVREFKDASSYYAKFFKAIEEPDGNLSHIPSLGDGNCSLSTKVELNLIRQNPLYSLAALRPGVYVIGMKDQLNAYDLKSNPLVDHVQYVADEMGFILFDRTKSKSVHTFGPYFIEQYILMEILSKLEYAQNTIDYFCTKRSQLQQALDGYDEQQGQGFLCWRFLINETAKAAAAAASIQNRSEFP